MTGIMKKKLGRIVKVHGCDGGLTVKAERNFSDNIPEMESVFLEIEGNQVPFFIEHYQTLGSDNVILWLEDYRSVEKVKEFVGCLVYIPAGDHEDTDDSSRQDIVGFELFSSDTELIGIVTKVTENPGQWLITVVSSSGHEILIPFHEDLIIKIDEGSKKIEMNLPEGLKSLN